MSSQKYNTKQKEILLQIFKETKDKHITVEDINFYLNERNIKIGKSTIYRNLDELVKNNIIRKYFIEEGFGACYQYNEESSKCKEHFHLKCIFCNKLIHIDCDFLKDINEHIKKYHKFYVENNKTVLYGKCQECSDSLQD